VPSKRTQRNGFTLAELLVASMLISIVMTAVYSMFHSTIRSWRNVEQDFNSYQDARNALTLIRRDMDNYLAAASFLMEGEDDEISLFVVSEPMNVEEGAGRHLLRVRYRHKRSAGELIREEAFVDAALPNRPRGGQELDRERIETRDEEEFLIARNVKDFEVRYIWTPLPGQRDEDLPPPWIEHMYAKRHNIRWDLPQGLELTLVLEDPENPRDRMTVQSTIVTRNPSRRMKREQLNEKLKGAF